MKPEILAPAGNMTCLQAAINAGADAIYLGLDTLNMRCGATVSFTKDNLPEASERCRAAGVKLYLTVNTIIFEGELGQLDDMLSFAKQYVDAAIVSDWAAVAACKRHGVPVHISTQMSCSNSESAAFLKSQGAERVVLARECTLEEVAEIASKVDIELETFVHGAICVAVSGRCFMSQHAYGFSANRGECRQPCRRKYTVVEERSGEGPLASFDVQGHNVFSARDLFALPLLDKLTAAGIRSFKIEGRGRNAEYVAAVTAAYREARDAIMAGEFNEELVARLRTKCETVYHRELAEGLYHGRPGKDQFCSDGAENLATLKKEHIGIITNYFVKAQVAELLVHNDALRNGDVLSIQGNATGVLDIVVDNIQCDGEPANEVPRGHLATFKCETRVRKNDIAYRMTEAVPQKNG